MTSKFQGFPGMEDILPGEVEKWQWVEEKARIFFEAHGFKEIRTPILEATDLFVRSIGQSSDIVHKEMFSFEDRGGRQMTMRPEMTASVARAVIEKGLLTQAKSLRFYYMGPMFRAERPQAGRKRQFHQIGIEIINESGAEADLDAILSLYGFLNYLGLNSFKLFLNDLGDEKTRASAKESLQKYFSKEKSKLCKDCQWRLEKNVFRIFDCKESSCQPVIEKAPWDECAPLSGSFSKLQDELKQREIPFQINRRLVRGLDYYNGTVFEVTAEGLGAQNAVAGGGRYDGLYQQLGSKATPCTGFSIGLERLLMSLDKTSDSSIQTMLKQRVYLAPLGNDVAILKICQDMAIRLREVGIRPELGQGVLSLSQHLKKASQYGFPCALILGADELQKKVIVFKDLEKREQTEVKIEETVAHLKKVMNLC